MEEPSKSVFFINIDYKYGVKKVKNEGVIYWPCLSSIKLKKRLKVAWNQ